MFDNPSTSTNLLKGLEVLLQNDAQEYIYHGMHVLESIKLTNVFKGGLKNPAFIFMAKFCPKENLQIKLSQMK
jgi:hypothetical protein